MVLVQIRRRRLWVDIAIFPIVWFFIRFGFGRITTTFDEAYYLSTINGGGVYSGLLTPSLLRTVNGVLQDPITSLLLVSLTFFTLYPLFLLKFQGTFRGYPDPTFAFLLALLLSSHYIWSSNAVRPQQIGLLVGLFLLLYTAKAFEDGPGNLWEKVVRFSLLWVLLAVSHIFSLLVFLALVWFIGLWYLIGDGRSLKVYVLTTGTSIFGFLVLLIPQYRTMVFSAKWILKHSSSSFLQFIGWNFFPSIFIAWVLIIVAGPIIAYLEGKWRILETLLTFIRGELRERNNVYLVLGVVIVFLLMGFQVYLGLRTYSGVYRGSFVALFIMQLGNIIFNVLALLGIVRTLAEKRLDLHVAVLLFLGILTLSALVISIFMPGGFGSFGFKNWMIRVYQYAVIFAAPVVAEEIWCFIRRRSFGRVFALILLLAISTSIVNVSRPPLIYNYPYYWTSEDLRLISHVGPGFVYLKTTLSPPENFEALSFLGWAYGNNIKPLPPNLSFSVEPDKCVSSLCHSPYPYHEIPLVSVNLNRINLIYGNLPRDFARWISSLMESSKVNWSDNASILVIGNSTLTPLIGYLEDHYLVPVSVNYSIVEGPTFRYYYAIKEGQKRGDVSRSLFVIQAISLNGTPTIVVSAPSLDGVAAGTWFLFTEVLKDRAKWENVSFIVGEWGEKDGRVLPVLRAFEGDTNGFSAGDEIKILKTGTVEKP